MPEKHFCKDCQNHCMVGDEPDCNATIVIQDPVTGEEHPQEGSIDPYSQNRNYNCEYFKPRVKYTDKDVRDASKTISKLLPFTKDECLHCDTISDNLVGGLCLDCRSKGVPYPDDHDLRKKIDRKENESA